MFSPIKKLKKMKTWRLILASTVLLVVSLTSWGSSGYNGANKKQNHKIISQSFNDIHEFSDNPATNTLPENYRPEKENHLQSEKPGTIKGVVKDGYSGETLIGANVFIEGTSLGTVSNLEGEYTLRSVPPGTYELNVRYVGYHNVTVNVEVNSGETVLKNIDMKYAAFEGEEVVITAQAQGQIKAINQQLSAKTINNIVSREKIEELPDANVAEAIGRLPGISLQRDAGEANKIVIRGLSPKYNNVTIEGMRMPSTNANDRSVDLSLIQNESLSGIEVTKSLTADMDADALGGTVNLRLRKAPENPELIFIAEGGYADITETFDNYKFSGTASNRFFNKSIGISVNATAEQKQLPSHTFSADYSSPSWNFILDDDDNIVDSALLVDTESMQLINHNNTRKRYSVSGIIDYSNNWWDFKFYNLYNRKADDIISQTNSYHFLHTSLQEPYRFQKNAIEEFSATDLRTHALQNTFSFLGTTLDFNVSASFARTDANLKSFPFSEEGLWRSDIPQSWLNYRQPSVAFDSTRALILGNTYLQEFNRSNLLLTDDSYNVRIDYEVPFKISDNFSGAFMVGGKYQTSSRESDQDGEYSNFRHGGGRDEREFLENNYDIILSSTDNQLGVNADNFVDPNYDPGDFLNGRYALGWGADIGKLTSIEEQFYNNPNAPVYWEDGLQSLIKDYTSTEKLTAGYIMTEINIGGDLMILPGIRFERMETEYFAYHTKLASQQTGIEPNPDSITVNRSNENFFPSVNVKYELTDNIQLQGAVYKSTSRPDFTQISPLVVYHHKNPVIYASNPYLSPSLAWNYDLGFSVYSNQIGLLSLYGYYKEIDDLIFYLQQSYFPSKKGLVVDGPADINNRMLGDEYFNENNLTASTVVDRFPINNSEKAYVKGLELSWQSNFYFLPGALNGLVLDVNVSVIDSKTKYPNFAPVQVGVDSSGFIPIPVYGQKYVTREGPMIDQPSLILNVILGWDYGGFSSRISYRYQEKTVQGIDLRYSLYDRDYDTFSLIDIMLKQKITPNWSVYLNLTNIGNHIDEYYFKEQDKNPRLPTRSEFYGFRAQAGVKFNL